MNDSLSYIFSLLCDKKPKLICKKMRVEGNSLIVFSADYKIEFLDEIAKDFIVKIDGHRTLNDILLLFKEEYDVDWATLVSDFIPFVRQLQWKRIVQLI